MPDAEDTQENDIVDMSTYKKPLLSILHMADERMLQESNNLVYLRMKAELDGLR